MNELNSWHQPIELNNVICSRSWTDLSIDFKNNTKKFCCEASSFPINIKELSKWNTDSHIEKRRLESIRNIVPNDCNACLNSFPSQRDFRNEWQKVADINPQLRYIEVDLDNFCDLSCIYCSSQNSTIIAQENNEKVIFKEPNKQILDAFLQWLSTLKSYEYKNKIFLSFLGGEPTLSPNYFRVMEYIYSNVDPLIFNGIATHTNGNTGKKNYDKFIKILDKFDKKVKFIIVISNESIKGQHLIRCGSHWETFENNVKNFFLNHRFDVISFVISINVFSIKETANYIQWLIEMHKIYGMDKILRIEGNCVTSPKELSIANCPKNYKRYLSDAKEIVQNNNTLSNRENILQWITTMEGFLGKHFDNFDSTIKFVEKLNKKKKVNLNQLLDYL